MKHLCEEGTKKPFGWLIWRNYSLKRREDEKIADCSKVDRLKAVIREKQIYPVFQPIVSLENGEVFAYEALSRIRDAQRYQLGIEEMFQTAEKNGMVWKLEEICRRQAMKGAKEKPKGTKLFINVNPNVLLDKHFESGITARFIKKYGLQPEDIVFEITERTPIQAKNVFKKTLDHYLQQNYTVAIDDFGSAYAGLDRLCYLKPQYLKFDMSLIRELDTDPLRMALVKHMIAFCREVDILVIAEGIETEKEADLLRQMGADFGQGYYFAKPGETFHG